MSISDKQVVSGQYATAARLNTRIGIPYLRSIQQMTALADVPDETLLTAFRARMQGGVLTLPKEYGIFCCR